MTIPLQAAIATLQKKASCVDLAALAANRVMARLRRAPWKKPKWQSRCEGGAARDGQASL